MLMIFLQSLNYIIDVYREHTNSALGTPTTLVSRIITKFKCFPSRKHYDPLTLRRRFLNVCESNVLSPWRQLGLHDVGYYCSSVSTGASLVV